MHLTLPPNFIDSIRKHTIQGKMAYAPIVFRLENGYTEVNINGFWDIFGFGLFGMYKSDWKSVGGWDIQKFANKWSGEDTELFERVLTKYDVFRIKLPGLFHYYHSKKGMWGRNGITGNIDKC
jgi:hypothetical protein